MAQRDRRIHPALKPLDRLKGGTIRRLSTGIMLHCSVIREYHRTQSATKRNICRAAPDAARCRLCAGFHGARRAAPSAAFLPSAELCIRNMSFSAAFKSLLWLSFGLFPQAGAVDRHRPARVASPRADRVLHAVVGLSRRKFIFRLTHLKHLCNRNVMWKRARDCGIWSGTCERRRALDL